MMVEIILYAAIGGTIIGNLIVWAIAEIADRIGDRR